MQECPLFKDSRFFVRSDSILIEHAASRPWLLAGGLAALSRVHSGLFQRPLWGVPQEWGAALFARAAGWRERRMVRAAGWKE